MVSWKDSCMAKKRTSPRAQCIIPPYSFPGLFLTVENAFLLFKIIFFSASIVKAENVHFHLWSNKTPDCLGRTAFPLQYFIFLF